MRKSLALSLVLLFLMSLVILQTNTVNAQTKTIVVPDDFPTIPSAIANATNGDTIYVKSGTYTEYEFGINKPISLIGENSGSTKLNLQSARHVGDPLYWYFPDLFPAPVWYDTAMKVRSDNFVLSGLPISTNGGDINITGNNNQIKGNSITAFTSIIGSDNQLRNNSIAAPLTILGSNNHITDNTFLENPTIKRLYDYDIAGNHGTFPQTTLRVVTLTLLASTVSFHLTILRVPFLLRRMTASFIPIRLPKAVNSESMATTTSYVKTSLTITVQV